MTRRRRWRTLIWAATLVLLAGLVLPTAAGFAPSDARAEASLGGESNPRGVGNALPLSASLAARNPALSPA
jgi:uncharacterized membrane protein